MIEHSESAHCGGVTQSTWSSPSKEEKPNEAASTSPSVQVEPPLIVFDQPIGRRRGRSRTGSAYGRTDSTSSSRSCSASSCWEDSREGIDRDTPSTAERCWSPPPSTATPTGNKPLAADWLHRAISPPCHSSSVGNMTKASLVGNCEHQGPVGSQTTRKSFLSHYSIGGSLRARSMAELERQLGGGGRTASRGQLQDEESEVFVCSFGAVPAVRKSQASICYVPAVVGEKNQPPPAGLQEGGQHKTVIHSAGKQKPPFMCASILASLMASCFFNMSVMTVKMLPQDSGFQTQSRMIFCRGCIISLTTALWTLFSGGSLAVRRDEWLVNLIRAILGTAGIYGCYMALKYISLGDSTAIIFASPIWTNVLAHYIFGEPFYLIHLLALPLCTFGIVLVSHPGLIINVDHLSLNQHHHLANLSSIVPSSLIEHNPAAEFEINQNSSSFDQLITQATSGQQATGSSFGDDFSHRWPGIVIALATSFVVSLVYITLKFRKSTPVQTTTFWLGIVSTATAFLVMCFIGFGQFPTTFYEWSILLANGLLSWAGQSVFQWAFSYEDAGILAIVRTSDVAISFILSAIFLDDDIYWTSILGSAIIVSVIVAIMLHSWFRRRMDAAHTKSDRLSRAQEDPNQLPVTEQNQCQQKFSEKLPGNSPISQVLKQQSQTKQQLSQAA